MQNTLHRRVFEFPNSKRKRIVEAPLCTIYESSNEPTQVLLPAPTPEPSSPSKKRDRSINPAPRPSLLSNPQRLSPSSALMKRTSSLSPARSELIDSSLSNKKLRLHIPGTQAGLLYTDHLTRAEQKEICQYQEVYYIGERSVKLEGNFNDSEFRYKAVIGDHLAFRYEILAILGKGTFGNVYKCFDHKRELMVAVKVMRQMQVVKDQAEIEIENLEKIGDSDPEDSKCIVKMRQCFEFRGHICICFELLSLSLYQFLKIKRFEGLAKGLIRRIAVQCLIALRHIHDLGFIHCDLKPENILLKQENKSSIKLIDFGSATYKCAVYSTYIQSRYYRAPEVILGCGYTNKIDIWSLGCILYELFSGDPLFTGENEHDHIIKIMHILGKPPNTFLQRARRKNEFFSNKNSPIMQVDSRGNILNPGESNLADMVEDSEFCGFLKKCLEWDPELRFSAEEALKHSWILKTAAPEKRREWYRGCQQD